MEELKLMLEMVAHLPAMAMWVLVGFFAYKVVVVGSIYGLIRFIVDRLHSYMSSPSKPLPPVALDGTLDRMVISGCLPDFVRQLKRLRGKGVGIKSEYLHSQSVEWLREAIDEKETKEVPAKAGR